MAQDPTTGPGGPGPGPEGVPPPAGEVQVDGNTLASDGAGNMTFDGADGSHAEWVRMVQHLFKGQKVLEYQGK